MVHCVTTRAPSLASRHLASPKFTTNVGRLFKGSAIEQRVINVIQFYTCYEPRTHVADTAALSLPRWLSQRRRPDSLGGDSAYTPRAREHCGLYICISKHLLAISLSCGRFATSPLKPCLEQFEFLRRRYEVEGTNERKNKRMRVNHGNLVQRYLTSEKMHIYLPQDSVQYNTRVQSSSKTKNEVLCSLTGVALQWITRLLARHNRLLEDALRRRLHDSHRRIHGS